MQAIKSASLQRDIPVIAGILSVSKWQSWFAWYPVTIWSGKIVWLKWVNAREVRTTIGNWMQYETP